MARSETQGREVFINGAGNDEFGEKLRVGMLIDGGRYLLEKEAHVLLNV